MFRDIIIPKERKVEIELPQEMVGKQVEVLAFDVQDVEMASNKKKPTIEEIKSFYASYQVDMSGYKFSREEANER